MFASWNPHFTPGWLCKRIADHIPSGYGGDVIDPACGAGNLLIAAALRRQLSNSTSMRLVGFDISARAVRECSNTLATLVPIGTYKVDRADFLRAPALHVNAAVSPIVVMNPPFQGYGRLSDRTRRYISKRYHMRGRFNLSHVFVRRAIEDLRPQLLVSVLPSNWVHSRGSKFRGELDSLAGGWEWSDVGSDVFRGVSAHVGILVWQPAIVSRSDDSSQRGLTLGDLSGVAVRQGSATGHDNAFIELADRSIPFGAKMQAARGRNVGGLRGPQIWIPPEQAAPGMANLFSRAIGRKASGALRSRSCVHSRRREIFQFHDDIPVWFRSGPKLLLPEIVSSNLRVEVDDAGKVFPLHSVLAIRVPSIAAGLKLRDYLMHPRTQTRLLREAPRLNGGAVRLQAGALRDMLVPAALHKTFRLAAEITQRGV